MIANDSVPFAYVGDSTLFRFTLPHPPQYFQDVCVMACV